MTMIAIYIIINRMIDLALRPFAGLAPIWPLAFWAAVMGVVAMLIYKYASSQRGIKDAKERIKGHFYEVWLYIDDAPVILKAQARIMFHAGRYLAYALVPLAIMIVLFFPLFANFETRYAMRPVHPAGAGAPGEAFLVKLRLAHEFPDWEKAASLALPPGLSQVGYPVSFVRPVMAKPGSLVEKRREYETDFKLAAAAPGLYQLRFTVQGQTITAPLVVGDGYGPRPAPYATDRLGQALLYPPAAAIPAGSLVDFIQIAYPAADFPMFGFDVWWVWPFLVISMLAAFAVKGVFKVEI